jgi:hypothetical protein
MDAVLGDLVFGYLLEEQSWTATVRVLERRPRIALLLRDADPGEKVVPRGERIGARRQLDSRRTGMDVPKAARQNNDNARGSWASKVIWIPRLIGVLRSQRYECAPWGQSGRADGQNRSAIPCGPGTGRDNSSGPGQAGQVRTCSGHRTDAWLGPGRAAPSGRCGAITRRLFGPSVSCSEFVGAKHVPCSRSDSTREMRVRPAHPMRTERPGNGSIPGVRPGVQEEIEWQCVTRKENRPNSSTE